jgi:caffeoyl-CoA O-methyltransferase
MRSPQYTDKETYIQSLFAPEDEPLSKVFSTLRMDEAHMQISPIEGKTLHTLVKMIGAKKIVEIGSLAGYSAIWMARALPEDGKLYAIDLDYKKEDRILKNAADCGVADKISLTIGKANEELPGINKYGPFDMVFIDADKGGYVDYLNWAEKNVRKGGLIVGDNTFLFGAVYGDNARGIAPETIEVMKEFNERLANPEKYTSIILPTAEGMTVAVKNF